MRLTLLLAALSGCGWGHLGHSNSKFLEGPLWDPDDAVSTVDGVYVRLLQDGGLVVVKPDGSFARVDVGSGAVVRLVTPPDHSKLLAFVQRYQCDVDDPKEKKDIETPSDCDPDDLDVRTDLLTIEDGSVTNTSAVDNQYNAIAFSPDGRIGIAYLDFDASASLEGTGVVDLTQVEVMNFESGSATPLSVGFAANNVLFDGSGQRAVVLSQSQVAVLDLALEPPTREVVFPLTLDPDQVVVPVGIELTRDGRYAMITAANQDNMYVLDLENHSVNLLSLSGAYPAAMELIESPTDPLDDRTVVVYGTDAWVDSIEHDLFEVEPYEVDEALNRIAEGNGFGLLYRTDGKDVYRFDPINGERIEFRLQNPATSVSIAPTNDFAIALTRAENGYDDEGSAENFYDAHPGLEVLELNSDSGRTHPFKIDGDGIGLAWTSTETTLHALLLQSGVSDLTTLDLYTGETRVLELPADPAGIGSIQDGPFFITHKSAIGMISFYDPDTDTLRSVEGFALLGFGDEIELEPEEAE